MKLSSVTAGATRTSLRISGGAEASDFSNQLSLARLPEPTPPHCALCAREASDATVFKYGSAYCSIECAEALPGLYLG